MNVGEIVKASPEDKEALKRLVGTTSFSSFIVFDAISELGLADKHSLTPEQARAFGHAIARSTEKVAASVVTGEWASPDENQEDLYANRIQPWLETLDENRQVELRAKLFYTSSET